VVQCNNFILAEFGEQAADGFQAEAEMAPDILMSHGEPELCCRVAPCGESCREVEQKHGKALFGVHDAKQEHESMIPVDLCAQQAVEVPLQSGELAAKLLEQVKGNCANAAVFNRDRIELMFAVANPIHPCRITGHEEAGHLF